MPFIDPVILNLAVALGIGLLIGAERERRKGEGPSRSAAGIRTFTITSLAGAVSVVVGGELLLAIATIGVVALTVPGQLRHFFLEQHEVAGSVREPVAEYGINVPDSTIKHLFDYTAGNPNFVGKVAHLALYRLNDEGRNVLTPQDIVEIVRKLSDDKGGTSRPISQSAGGGGE